MLTQPAKMSAGMILGGAGAAKGAELLGANEQVQYGAGLAGTLLGGAAAPSVIKGATSLAGTPPAVRVSEELSSELGGIGGRSGPLRQGDEVIHAGKTYTVANDYSGGRFVNITDDAGNKIGRAHV